MTSVSHRAPTTPEDLLARFRTTRDPGALGELFDETAPSLLRVALSIAPDAASAENALQETFLAVLEAPERWDETRPVMPWLLGILHRQVGKVRRDNARRPDPLRLPPPLSDDPSAVASSNEEQARVRAAIDELPEPYRAVAVLRWRHGLDPADIADVRGEPPGTTRSLLSRALEKLRERLGAGAFALFGWPGTPGLADIRRALMSKATATTVAGTTAAAVGGAFVMKKLVAACVVLVLLGGGTWWTVDRISRSSAAARSRESAVAAAAAAERKRKRAAEPAPSGEIPPVDLDKCDRDLDLFGRVIDEDGKPVGGAKVETLRHPWRGIDMSSTARWYETESGPSTRTAIDGTFAIRLERGEKFNLRVSADGFGDIAREDCQAGERVEITLRRGATLDVTTVDEAGAPVAGVRVKLSRNPRRIAPLAQSREAVTDAAGHVAMTGLLPGSVYVDYLHPTLGKPKFEVPILPATGTLMVRVTMRAGRTVKGRVTDADTAKPIAGALVDSWNFQRPVTTDADGRYTLSGWTDEGSALLEAKAAGYLSAYRDLPADGDADLALHLGDRVVGRIVRADGAPVDGAQVGMYGPSGDKRGTKRPGDAASMSTAADGHFDFTGLSRDLPHMLIVVAPGLARNVVDFDRQLWSGAVIDLGDVVMTAGRSIEGVAVDLDGKPLADAAVSLADSDDDSKKPGWFVHRQSRRTDDLGRFRFPDLAAGDYFATVEARSSPRGPPTSIDLPADRDVLDARVTLGGSRTLSVLVVDDLGAPLADMWVMADIRADSKTEGLLDVITGADGRVTFRGVGAVPATTYVWLNNTDGSNVSRSGPFPLDGQEVRIVAHRTVEVRGVVRGEDGKPLRSYVTATSRRDGSAAGTGSSDETGAFTMKAPLGEIVDLWARGTIPDAHGSTFTGFEGRANGVTGPKDGVEIVLRPVKVTFDRALTVVVQDSTGVPFPGVEIGIYERNPEKSWKVKTDADGRARFDGLANHLVVLNFAEMQELAPQHALDIAPAHFGVTPNGQEIVVKYRAGAAIRGRVVDAQGRGVAEPYIQVTTADGTYINVRGDADGRFTAPGLAGQSHQLLAAGYADGTPSQGTVEKVVPGDAELTITVAPPPAK